MPFARPARDVGLHGQLAWGARVADAAATSDAATAGDALVTTQPQTLLVRGERGSGRLLAWAFGGSLLVHAGLLAWAMMRPATSAGVPLPPQAQLLAAVAFDVKLPQPAPPPVVAPPVVEQPVAPAPVAEAAPVASHAPRPVVRQAKPATTTAKVAPAQNPAPRPEVAVATAGAGQVEVAAEAGAEQGAETAPALPATVLAQPGGPSQTAPGGGTGGDGFDLMGYGRGVMARVARQQRYPEEASDRGWEGTVEVHVRISRDGQLVGAPTVVRSSGYPALDREALRMVRAAAPFQVLPNAYRDDLAEFDMPIEFTLVDGGDF